MLFEKNTDRAKPPWYYCGDYIDMWSHF